MRAGYLWLQTHAQECEIILAFPLQQCLHELASLLRYTYMTCIVFSRFDGGYYSDCFLSVVTPYSSNVRVSNFMKIVSAILELY